MVLFLATPLAYGQRITSFPAAKAACGPENLKFDVSPDAGEAAVVSKASGKALVYVIEDVRKGALLRMTTRFGVDGAWVGANQGDSHFSFLVDPGDHHLCVNGQWTRLTGEPSIALLHLAARAGGDLLPPYTVSAASQPWYARAGRRGRGRRQVPDTDHHASHVASQMTLLPIPEAEACCWIWAKWFLSR